MQQGWYQMLVAPNTQSVGGWNRIGTDLTQLGISSFGTGQGLGQEDTGQFQSSEISNLNEGVGKIGVFDGLGGALSAIPFGF